MTKQLKEKYINERAYFAFVSLLVMFKNKYIKISKDTEKSIERRAIKEAKQELKENQQELGMDFLLNDK
ncbi:hypothetical protein ACXX84_03790 [Mycoplasma sp. AC157]